MEAMTPFFLSAPRTRSSILFELAQYYVEQDLGLRELEGHTEFFLMKSPWAMYCDKRTDKEFQTQMMPSTSPGGDITIHHVYPPIYRDVYSSLDNKLAILETARDRKVEFNIKGTIECAKRAPQMVDFYSDRHFVITRRRSMEQLVASTLFALHIKAFHARPNNYDKYMQSLEEPVELSLNLLATGERLVRHVLELWDMEHMIRNKGIPYTVTYYEDLSTPDAIADTLTEILGTPDWVNYLPLNFEQKVPLKIEKDYSKLITNYDQLVDRVAHVVRMYQ